MEKKLTVAEHFYSIQGEGRTTGVPSIFVRLAGCNLMCGGKGTEKDGQLHHGATWRCDSIEVWRKGKNYTAAELVDILDREHFYKRAVSEGAHVIITGGEPLLQQEGIFELMVETRERCFSGDYSQIFEIETNGTIMPLDKVDAFVGYWNVSPKLSNSGEQYKDRIKDDVMKYFSTNRQSIFKFVVSSIKDFLEAKELIKKYMIHPSKVWLMPAADNRETLTEVSERVAQYAILNTYNFSSRLHIHIWNKKTGV